jgi:hypothetical protein
MFSRREIRYRVNGKFMIAHVPLSFTTFYELKSYLYNCDPRVGYPSTVLACVRKAGSHDEGAWMSEGCFQSLLPVGEEYDPLEVQFLPLEPKIVMPGWFGKLEVQVD